MKNLRPTIFINRPKWLRYSILILGIHLLGLALLFPVVGVYPQFLGIAFLAYTLGLRHAFDVDHITAIDNTVRKMMQQKQEPTGVGFFFSLGHSSVVFIMALITSFSMTWAKENIPQLQAIGGLIGTVVSGGFLLLIGLFNLYIWFDIYRLFKKMHRGKFDEGNLEKLLLNRGFISHLFRPFYQFISKSWHVYPLGFLFGLGFDTASEVALLAISANAASTSMPSTAILSLPVLFAAGMSMMDTADGVFMITAYDWAFSTPLRKVYYNLSVTGVSVVAALFIGLIELAQIVTPKLGLNGSIWEWIQKLDLSGIGYLLAGLFVFGWGVSFLLWKVLRLEHA
ncbi:HoxN/HupN/NixA family nickel/cobalt transporter [Desulfitobacterium metallireducens]|uniref:Nickel/cobalt efflux system n=1 Tax=Desulfitobacterium metallireducens DSM 15288 TaxID=871968 RepID=W0EB52_9FIRM|nr:HoxN/HupN/NixA family nickel/cobalt transporter [Desulfitobacterium metallireducens]AHF06449.1 nickel transporter NixA [Desulfitobacterium metallireducens DSM 15288]